MTNHDTILQNASRTAQQTQHATRAGSHRNRNGGSLSAHRGVPDVVIDVLASPGHRMEESIRREMEAKLGADFSDVRVHTGPKAAAAADSINARAFTYGNQVVFNQREYDPISEAGRKLISHELVHVVQQTRNETYLQLNGTVDQSMVHPQENIGKYRFMNMKSDLARTAAEKEANIIAQQVISGKLCEENGTTGTDNGKIPDNKSTDIVKRGRYSPVREAAVYWPSIQMRKCIQRNKETDMKKVKNVMLGDGSEIPRDRFEHPSDNMDPAPGSTVTVKQNSTDDGGSASKSYLLAEQTTCALFSAESNWKIVAPMGENALLPKGTEQVVKDGSTEDVISRGEASNRWVDCAENVGRKLMEYGVSKPKALDILSGMPAGQKISNNNRYILGPVEKHFFGAARALQPQFNNNIINIEFANEKIGQAQFVAENNRKLAHCKGEVKGSARNITKYYIKTRSMTDWRDNVMGSKKRDFYQQFHFTVIIAKSFGWNREKIKKIGWQAEAEGPEIHDDKYEITEISPLNTSQVEAAHLLAAFLISPNQYYSLPDPANQSDNQKYPYMPALFGRLTGRFIRENLDNAVKLIEKEGEAVSQKGVGTFAQNLSSYYTDHKNKDLVEVDGNLVSEKKKENPKSALYSQTLVNMATEVARAVHEMGLVTIQYIEQKNKNWDKVEFNNETELKNQYNQIASEKSLLLEQYAKIIDGIKELEAKNKKQIKSQVNAVVGAIGSAGTAGIGTGFTLGVISQVSLNGGWAISSKLLSDALVGLLTPTGKNIKPSTMNLKWNRVVKTKKSKYKAEFMQEFKKESPPPQLKNNDNEPLETLGSLMLKEIERQFDSPFIE